MSEALYNVGGLRFCKDCKWQIFLAQGSPSSEPEVMRPFCAAPKAISFDLVSGEPRYDSCYSQRIGFGSCGTDAKNFQP